jgi:acyl carrier protein
MMSTNNTALTPVVPTEHEVAEAILELAAAAQDRPVNELRDQFNAAGPGMPIDSLEAVEILIGLEERFDVRLPDDQETCAAFRSMGGLIERVRQIAGEGAS